MTRARRWWGNLTPFGQDAARFLAVALVAAVTLAFALLSARDAQPVPQPADVGHGVAPVVMPVELAALVGSSDVVGASDGAATLYSRSSASVTANSAGASSTAFELAVRQQHVTTESEEVRHATTAVTPLRGVEVGGDRSSASLTPATPEEAFVAALASSPWPRHLWADVTEIARCESQFDPSQTGDGGNSHGALQIHEPSWPRLVRSFDLYTLRENLTAAYIAYLEAGRSFEPWTCWRAR